MTRLRQGALVAAIILLATGTYIIALTILAGAFLISGQYDVVLLPVSNYGTE